MEFIGTDAELTGLAFMSGKVEDRDFLQTCFVPLLQPLLQHSCLLPVACPMPPPPQIKLWQWSDFPK